MPLTPKVIPANPAASGADWNDVAALQQRMVESCDQINRMILDVGLARHVLEYNSDLRKRALARAMAAPLAGGASAAAAEAEARASESYSAELAALGKQHQEAETILAEFDAVKLKFETARSLLSMAKESLRQL